jgi:hypothetical protein
LIPDEHGFRELEVYMTASLAQAPLHDSVSDQARTAVPPAQRESLIREQAYALAERRGFGPGHELDDWLAAEQTINESLKRPSAAAVNHETEATALTDDARIARPEREERTLSVFATNPKEQHSNWFKVPRTHWFIAPLNHAREADRCEPWIVGASRPAEAVTAVSNLARLAEKYRPALSWSRLLGSACSMDDSRLAVALPERFIAAINEWTALSQSRTNMRVTGERWDQWLAWALAIDDGEGIRDLADDRLDQLVQAFFLLD